MAHSFIHPFLNSMLMEKPAGTVPDMGRDEKRHHANSASEALTGVLSWKL